jgi:PTH1 family peptidyl-tRNA hydrolase
MIRLFRKKPDWLVVGLGNPGREYAETRHNVGFQVLDGLAKRHELCFSEMRFRGLLARGELCGRRVVLLKPMAYMNRSGSVVRPTLKYYGLSPDQLLVIHDDIDLPLGRLRVREGGGSGGHKGMESIIAALGTEKVSRLRLGIGRSNQDPEEYVLREFSREEGAIMEEAYQKVGEAVEFVVREGLSAAMNRFNEE